MFEAAVPALDPLTAQALCLSAATHEAAGALVAGHCAACVALTLAAASVLALLAWTTRVASGPARA